MWLEQKAGVSLPEPTRRGNGAIGRADHTWSRAVVGLGDTAQGAPPQRRVGGALLVRPVPEEGPPGVCVFCEPLPSLSREPGSSCWEKTGSGEGKAALSAPLPRG